MKLTQIQKTQNSPVEKPSNTDTVALVLARKDAAARDALKSLKKSPALLSSFSSEEIIEWVRLGRKLMNSSKKGKALSREYFIASSTFLTPETWSIFEYWVKSALQISRYSFKAAIAYIRSTPIYLKHKPIYGVQTWTEEIVDILKKGKSFQASAIGFIRLSPEMLNLVHHNQFESWKKTGLAIAEKSPNMASAFFSVLPDKLDSLFITEQKNLFKSVLFIAGTDAQAAVQFYRECPKNLMRLNPDIRNRVMGMANDFCHKNPKNFLQLFYGLTSNLSPLSYPNQERVLNHSDEIGRFSTYGAIAFLENIIFLTNRIPDHFLSNWVSEGISIIRKDLQKGTEYFSLKGREPQGQLSKWSSAINFEDIRSLISLYTTALCGENLRIQTVDETTSLERFDLLLNPKKKDTIYLPSYYAEGWKQDENFCFYKVAAAHQAGHKEFGTFDSNFDLIWKMLDNFPVDALAKDIFLTLEDGRINARLKKTYTGLRKDLDHIFLMEIRKRSFPQKNSLMITMESIRRLAFGFFDENMVPPEFEHDVSFFRSILEGFYEKAESNWDSYYKAAEIYKYLRPLTETCNYIPFVPQQQPERLDIPTPGGERYPEKKHELITEDVDHFAMNPPDDIENFTLSDILKNKIMSQGLPRKPLSGLPTNNETVNKDDEGFPGKKQPHFPADFKSGNQEGPYYYDEWDYLQGAYRKRWCCLYEKMNPQLSEDRYNTICREYKRIIKKVKKQFQRIRPVILEPIRRVEWGDEIDLDEIIHSVVDRKLGSTPSEKIFQRKEKIHKRISILLLMDMSASTDEIVRRKIRTPTVISVPSEQSPQSMNPMGEKNKRILDILTESLVVIIEALEELGDPYSVFGFSGQGRHQVKFYTIKNFSEAHSDKMRCRIGAIQPKQSTRMGCAIRHAINKFKNIDSDTRLLILLSDGFPQDLDYGEDRTSKSYALHDTFMAFAEARREGIQPFCITVDQTGNDYLKKIHDPKSYLLIEDIDSLPMALPKIVESLIV